ncbi:hypothetical protein TNIN_354031 [Trichonephila inaurata madagascariensis]|uniref:Secreted protein n=1 Tax=Trichonephila inaurata madagascariensis TaxID=2747483 RepID=A0A8X7C7P0_9ARAC|nr:hypothetical protein TNIN_354031 [Trichonephila inaurata madagascariensis]
MSRMHFLLFHLYRFCTCCGFNTSERVFCRLSDGGGRCNLKWSCIVETMSSKILSKCCRCPSISSISRRTSNGSLKLLSKGGGGKSARPVSEESSRGWFVFCCGASLPDGARRDSPGSPDEMGSSFFFFLAFWP